LVERCVFHACEHPDIAIIPIFVISILIWGLMNLKHWRHFLSIAEVRSLTGAAERLGVPQPVLSREMRDLEASLGNTLFVRHARGVALTPNGEIFRRRAEAILRDIARLPSEVAGGNHIEAGTLSLGMPPSMAGPLTGPLVAQFRRQFPQVRLHLREATSIDIRNGLLGRELDLGILSTPLIEPQLALHPLIEEPMVLVGPPNCDLDPARPVTTTEIAALPLILARRPNSTRIILEHAMESIGLAPNIVIEIDTAPIGDLIRRELGYSVLPSCFLASHRHHQLRYAPVRGLWIGWMIGSLRNLPMTPAAQRMADMMLAMIAEPGDWPLWTDETLRQGLRGLSL
jgi:LysR family transcriptional regulator, nitrogen assimilation regulatory protein